MVLRLEHLKTSTEIDSTRDIAFTFNSHPQEMKFTPHGIDTVSLAGQRGTVGNDNIDVIWMTGRLYLDDRINSHEDIRTFLNDSFEEIKTSHHFKRSIPALWPHRGNVDTLVRKSSVKFIWRQSLSSRLDTFYLATTSPTYITAESWAFSSIQASHIHYSAYPNLRVCWVRVMVRLLRLRSYYVIHSHYLFVCLVQTH